MSRFIALSIAMAMADNVRKLQFVVFDDTTTSFRDWQFQVEGVIFDNGWSEVISHPYEDQKHLQQLKSSNFDSDKYDQLNSQFERFLRRSMKLGSEAFNLLRDVDSEYGTGQGRKAWQSLLERYASNRISRAIQLTTKMFSIRWSPDSTLADFKSRFDEVWRDLRDTGKAPSTFTVVAYIIGQLPPHYDVIRKECEELLDTAPSSLTVESLFRKLLSWKVDDTSLEDHRAYYANQLLLATNAINAAKPPQGKGQQRQNRRTVQCYNCKELGHTRRQCQNPCRACTDHHAGQACPKRFPPSSATKPTALVTRDGDVPVCLHTDHQADARSVNLVCDSGATDHFLSDRTLFATLQLVDSSTAGVQGSVAGAPTTRIVAKGTTVPITVNLPDGSTTCLTFDASYVPGLAHGLNIIATSKIVAKGHSFSLGTSSWLTLSGGPAIPLHVSDGLTFLRGTRPSAPAALVTLFDLHKQLCHVNYDDAERVADLHGIVLDNRDRVLCEHCQLGKHTRSQARMKLPSASITPVTSIVHSDIFGPATDSFFGKKRFAIVFIHGMTRYAHVYFMKHKSEALVCFQQFCRDARLLLPFDTLRADNDSVYRSQPFIAFCAQHQILQQFSSVDTQSQNGVAERYWRTLQDATVTLLAHAGLQKPFWTAAMAHANYVRNRLPHSALQATSPYTAATGTVPDMSALPTFGATAFVHVERSRRRKLDVKARRGIFLGVSPDSQSYLIWASDTNQLLTSRHSTIDVGSISPLPPLSLFGPSDDTPHDSTPDDDLSSNTATAISTSSSAASPTPPSAPSTPPSAPSPLPSEPTTASAIETADDDFLLDSSADVDWAALCLNTSCTPAPATIKQARAAHDWHQWKTGIIDQVSAVVNNDVFVPDSNPTSTVLDSKIVLTYKHNELGEIIRHKARFTPKGYQQTHGLNFFETFAPVASMDTTRTFLAIGAARNYDIHQFDIDDAFTTSPLDEDVWMRIPADIMAISEIASLIADKFGLCYDNVFAQPLVVKLLRSIYGLKQSNRNFSQLLDAWLVGNDFHRSKADSCLYRHGDNLWVLVYVDDLLVMGDPTSISHFKSMLTNRFGIKDLGPVHWYLGMEISRNRTNGTLQISQTQYIKDVLAKFNMSDCHPRSSPLPTGLQLPKATTRDTDFPYRELVGSLLYAAKATRPDIVHAVGLLTRHLIAPTNVHVHAAKNVLRYLQGTLNHHLCYSSTAPLVGWADSDWAGDAVTRKSTSGFVLMLNGGPVAFGSTLQRTVALSSAAAEYMSACTCIERIVFIRQLLAFFNQAPDHATPVMEDNTSCIKIATNPVATKRTRHIELRYHYVREQVARGIAKFIWIPTDQQLADVFTKADIASSSRTKFNQALLGMLPSA